MNSFNEATNKAMLWSLLFEGGIFNNISDNSVTLVQDKLDQVMIEVEQVNDQNISIKELNKQVCQKMILIVDNIRENQQKQSMQQQPQSMQKQSMQPQQQQEKQSITEPVNVTAEQQSANNQAKFTNGLEERQQEFNSLMSNKQPSEIDFSDKTEEPISDLDKALEDLQSRRNFELESVINSQDNKSEEAAKWVNVNNNNNIKTLKIGEEVDEKASEEVKKVTFNEPDVDDFLNQLKTSTETEERNYVEPSNHIVEQSNHIVEQSNHAVVEQSNHAVVEQSNHIVEPSNYAVAEHAVVEKRLNEIKAGQDQILSMLSNILAKIG